VAFIWNEIEITDVLDWWGQVNGTKCPLEQPLHPKLHVPHTYAGGLSVYIYNAPSLSSSMSTPPASRLSLPRQTLEPESYLPIGQRVHHDDGGWKSSASSVFDFNATSHTFTTTPPNRPRSRASPLLRDRRHLQFEELQNGPISCIVISGGTGCNAICSAFEDDTVYVLPVSDDGGSSSEIIRVLGTSPLSLLASPFLTNISRRPFYR
jgi:hypothetical protein